MKFNADIKYKSSCVNAISFSMVDNEIRTQHK